MKKTANMLSVSLLLSCATATAFAMDQVEFGMSHGGPIALEASTAGNPAAGPVQVINSLVRLRSYFGRQEAPTAVFGDADLSGVFDIADANRLSDWTANRVPRPPPGTLPFILADVNGDGTLDTADALLFANRLVGITYTFPAENWASGNANLDGILDMQDLNLLVDWLLLRKTPPPPGSMQFLVADVNGDGLLNPADLNLYVDKLLGRISNFAANMILGDANNDGAFNNADMNLLQDWILGRQPMPAPGSKQFSLTDVNGDGVLDARDLNLFADRILCRIMQFPMQPPAFVPGDANLDGVFDYGDIQRINDWLLLRRTAPAAGTLPFILANVNGDGAVDITDLNWMVDRYLGRIQRFRIELYGDNNLDGTFDMTDLNRLVDWINGRGTPAAAGTTPYILSDVNGDGILNTADVNLYSDRLVSRIAKFPPETCAPGKYWMLTATWQNISPNYLTNVSAQVATLTGGNQLFNRSIDQTTDMAISPGEYFSGTFRIQYASCSPFVFLIDLNGSVSPALP